MAKFTVTYEGNIVKRELVFRGDTYVLTMVSDPSGIGVSDEQSFFYQYVGKYPENEDEMEVTEQLDLLSVGDEYEIQEALEALDKLE